MPVSGDEYSRIEAALLNAYPTENDLARMLRIEMGESLPAIAGGNDQTERVFVLVRWAESKGRLGELLRAAINHNPRNPELVKLASELSGEFHQDTPTLINKESAIPAGIQGHAGLHRITPFIGTIPYDSNSADLFYGRSQEVEAIVRQLEQGPLLVINGRSGSGKTSLLRAGVIPRMKALGRQVIYASILDSPRLDVIRAIQNAAPFPSLTPAPDIVAALNLHNQLGRGARVYLIIDQMERCFTLPSGSDERNMFWRDIARIIGGESKIEVSLALAVRADWLYAFQTANPLADTFPIFSFIRLIEPLSVAQAKEAFVGPLSSFGVDCQPTIVDRIIADLTASDGYVNPPQLQIVGRAIYEHIQSKPDNEGKSELTLADYEALDGTSTILRQHLIKVIKLLGPKQGTCWQILLKLIDSDNNRISRSENELRGSVTEDEFRPIVNILAGNALIVRDTSTTDNSLVYVLAHDYLVTEIQNHLEADHKLQALKNGEYYLTSGYQDLLRAQESDRDAFIPLEKERYLYIWEYKEAFDGITTDIQLYLAKSALYHAQSSFGYWFRRLPSAAKTSSIAYLARLLPYDSGNLFESRLKAVSHAVRAELPLEDRKEIADGLFPVMASNAISQHDAKEWKDDTNAALKRRRQAVARILWPMRGALTGRQRAQLVPPMAVYNLNKYGPALMSMAIGALIMSVVLLISWFVNDRLSGTWTELPILHAGQITTLGFDSTSAPTVYVATLGGPNKGDRTTVTKYSTTTNTAEIIGSNLAFEGISAMVVLNEGGWQRFVAGVWGRGIYIKDGQESEWKLNNRGISSYAISSLVADPHNSQQLYAGASNYGGVFQSADAGSNWHDISGETLSGVSVTSMASSLANDGAILAGSVDGRVFRLDLGADDEDWNVVAAFPGEGEITALASEPISGQLIYAGSSTGSVSLSNDGGLTWMMMSRLPNVFRISSVAVKPAHPEVVFVNAYGIGGHNTWVSRDYGVTWETVPDNSTTREYLKLSTTADDTDALYAYGSAGLFLSRDEGSSWQYQDDINAPVAAVGIIETSQLAGGATYIVVGGSVFSSAEEQRSKWMRSRNLPAVDVRTIVPDSNEPATAYAGVYLPNRWSVYVTYDNGLNWESTGIPTQISERYLNDAMAIAVANDDDEHIIYVGTNGCGVFHSVDRGRTWNTHGRTDCDLPDTDPTNVLKIAVDPHDINSVYVVADGSVIYSSRDRGEHWQSKKLDAVDIVNGLVVAPDVSGRIFLITGVEGVWRSDDAGKNWRKPSSLFDGKYLVDLLASDQSNHLFVVSLGAEVWRSTDGGENWQNINRNLVANSATSLTYDRRTDELILGTIGAGIHSYTSGSLFQ